MILLYLNEKEHTLKYGKNSANIDKILFLMGLEGNT